MQCFPKKVVNETYKFNNSLNIIEREEQEPYHTINGMFRLN